MGVAFHSVRRGSCRNSSSGLDPLDSFVSVSQALVVADHGSISRAAQILGVRQSAVSRRIQALEDDLGVSLFERHSNGVRLTNAGKRFFELVRTAFADMDYAFANAAAAGRGVEGLICVGVLPSIFPGFLSRLVGAFHEAQPGIAFECVEEAPEKLISRIMDRRLDVAFMVAGATVKGCDTEILWSSDVCIALSAGHPLSGCESIDWELLKDAHFIFGREATAAGYDRHASERLSTIGARLSSARYDLSQESVMQFVALDFGFSLLNDSSTGISYPGVVFRPLAGDNKLSYSAVWLPGNDNPALRRFLSLARSMSAETRPPKA
ncbi:LysR family transcriptional regulator [Methylocystis parvus]|uniref:LysR family transcriptional regulator n=1 Tax=Methylocystis parvus TaxID=134 RepID=A0A6B8MB02_9HYPH|nr:LysR family transcriptional regulator [Methylocystis parvus]QGM99866.1 LysR family transcriptional regulator [Methylocystis parvus]WBK02288.1 LysR family transcriptional regulator [Methylocystis parvus OBBP]